MNARREDAEIGEDAGTRGLGDAGKPERAASSLHAGSGVIGIGVDIVETERIEASIERLGDRFLQRVFTEREIAYCTSMKFSARHYAARFAAKEAVSKAFGTGIGKSMGLLEIEVVRGGEGAPAVVLHGGAKEFAERLGVTRILLSLSHADHYAVASIVIVGS